MERKLVVLFIGLSLAGVGLANHPHYLQTPGTCVEDIAGGQTAKGPGEGGYHQFHNNVHLGQPGTDAFSEGGQVAVGKGDCPESYPSQSKHQETTETTEHN